MAGPRRNLFQAADQLVRTTAFRLTLVYLALFIAFATLVLGYTAWHARRFFEDRITQQIETEVEALSDQYRQGGERRLVAVLERRGRRLGNALYLLSDTRGDSITGNILLRTNVLDLAPGWAELSYTFPEEGEDHARPARFRIYTLPSGTRLLVGRDLAERERMQEFFRRARRFSILMALLVGAVSAFFVTRRVLSRVDGVAEASQRIMAGSLSERLPVEGSNDEFDRLAGHLNTMLDRISTLMAGLRDLSDNVAHDLRTPLTRLRNAAEDSLRKATTLEEARGGLERAIEESDKLIRVFDQLQMIARAETGNLAASLEPVALDSMLDDMAELYGPTAEEAGVTLTTAPASGLAVLASRELLGRALANLIENALKYGRPEQGGGSIALSARAAGAMIEIVVADNGRGVPEDAREKVLERFVRLDKARHAPGFGLGLSLVNAVVRLMGGALRLEDNAPGLRVVLAMPKNKAGELTRPIAQAAPRADNARHDDA